MDFRGKNILIAGFGVSGQAAARFLLERGAKVSATDLRRKEEMGLFPRDLAGVEGFWGGHSKEIFKKRDLIVVSPGVPNDLAGLQVARRLGISVIGEFGLAAEMLHRKKANFIAVTGTNGKSTTVTLITEILQKAGREVVLAGNIGTPLLEIVMENKQWDWIVTEVSSYQLETAPRFHPRIAVLLNITEDHLDRYASLKEYAQAKFRIFREQTGRDLLIYKEDDPVIGPEVRKVKARSVGFSIEKNLKDETIVLGAEKYPLERVKLVGTHNVENIIASIASAREAGVKPGVIQKVLEEFDGLPHRTQFVRACRGVTYYDDSKGTNVDAVVKSLAGFPDGRVILIAGGRDKGGDYGPLREAAAQKVKLLIAIGESRKRIAEAIGDATQVATAQRLEEAVPLAEKRASSGDVVLLSPACSSFDQFRDYKERGNTFQRLVKEL